MIDSSQSMDEGLLRILNQLEEYEHGEPDVAAAREVNARSMHAGMMKVGRMMERMLVESLTSSAERTPDAIERARLSVHTYVGLVKQVRQYGDYLERLEAARRKRAESSPRQVGEAPRSEDPET